MEQDVNKYLNDFLTKIEPYILSLDDEKKVARDKVGFILEKLERKKFRRKITEKQKGILRGKVEDYIKEGKPIHFVIPFGGYKHYWNESSPEPDWAEVFNMRFLTDYVSPLLAVYEPGVVIEYISEDLIIPLMNNYSEESTQQYWDVFSKLLEWYGQFLPANLTISGFRVGDRYSKQTIIEDVQAVVPEKIVEFDNLSDEEKEREIHRSVRNVNWNGKIDLTKLSDEEKRQRIIESRVVELAYYDAEAKPENMGNYLWDNIMVLFSSGMSQDNVFEDLTLKSNYGSVTDFWPGRGIIEHRDGVFMPRTVSRKQYEEIQANLQAVKIDPSLISFKNFEIIEIVN